MTQKRKRILPRPSRRYQETRPPLSHQGSMDSKNGLLVQNLQDGNQNMQFFNLGPPESIPTNKRPKMKEKRQKWSREELKEISY